MFVCRTRCSAFPLVSSLSSTTPLLRNRVCGLPSRSRFSPFSSLATFASDASPSHVVERGAPPLRNEEDLDETTSTTAEMLGMTETEEQTLSSSSPSPSQSMPKRNLAPGEFSLIVEQTLKPCFVGQTVGERHSLERKVIGSFFVRDIGLSKDEEQRFLTLLGPRYDAKSGRARIAVDREETAKENLTHLHWIIDELIKEARISDPSDASGATSS